MLCNRPGISLSIVGFFLGLQGLVVDQTGWAQQQEIPAALQPWQGWASWGDTTLKSPPSFEDASEKMTVWPGQLTLTAGPNGAEWKFSVTVFDEAWLPLPGNDEVWPQQVVANGAPQAVIERNARPAVRLLPGRHELNGQFLWTTMPQHLPLPPEIGLLTLVVNDEKVEVPNWDADGTLWLTRKRTGEAEADSVNVQVFRLFEDGIPAWLHTDLELTVSGKSREEEFGWILPEGWKLASVESALPVSVDERGRVKAQVRAGKWTISFLAFKTSDDRILGFPVDAQPTTNLELIGFKSDPEFRLAEFTGLQAVDVTQTSFPKKWQGWPVFQWTTSQKINLEEKMRGMGMQRPAGLTITRHLWLDEDGQGFTYHDLVSGNDQKIWRLDAASGLELGSVRVNGTGQLITESPGDNESQSEEIQTHRESSTNSTNQWVPSDKSQGVEIRTRRLNLEAIGRIKGSQSISATGWQTDTDHLAVSIDLPPGWRALAIFGADQVDGDWLTAWSLLDLFLLLIFSAAVFRLFGFWAGLVAFLAFGLSYHEPGAPRFLWLFLLFPIALLRVVKNDHGRRWIKVWRFLAVGLLVLFLLPFLWSQLQATIYPQLEKAGINYRARSYEILFGSRVATVQSEQSGYLPDFDAYNAPRQSADVQTFEIEPQRQQVGRGKAGSKFRFEQNLKFDPKAQIQTGPAQPDWSWNQVQCSWNGPVAAEQKLRPILISLNQHRALTGVRIAAIMLLGMILLGIRWQGLRRKPSSARTTVAATALLLLVGANSQAAGQEIPDAQTLQLLAERLRETSDAFPNAAVIPKASLQITGNRVEMEAEIHTALEVAVPLPGKLPAWSPVSVTVDGKARDLVCRHKGYLWTVLPKGVHQVVVETLLPDVADWEWTFLLKPKTVEIEAADWNVTGVKVDGVPEQQIFFARKQPTVEGAAAFDRRDFSAIVAVDRYVEAGLVWQVRNEVTRLSKKGKAVSIKVPLLRGENVLTSNVVVEGGAIEVRFGADEDRFSWESELPRGREVILKAPATDQWIERWHLVTSPVWNVKRTGLAPIFEANETDLVPVWRPWPNEEVNLTFSEPTAIVGATTTIQRVNYRTDLGHRQQTATLKIDLESSLGGDFPVKLEPKAEISSITVDTKPIPVRRVDDALIVPVHPGKQSIEINWRTDKRLGTTVAASPIRLPFPSANVTAIMNVPASQWILWASGPTLGPAIRFWVILPFAVLTALTLGSIKDSPLGRIQWVLLAIGLTQVHVAAAIFVVLWLFAIVWRRRLNPQSIHFWLFNLRQLLLLGMTVIALGILVVVVSRGMLGNPEMFIIGNGSYRTYLKWFQARVDLDLPQPCIVSISVWYYRLLMLIWSLWLAFALLGWLSKAWLAFVSGGAWRRNPRRAEVPPLPLTDEQVE